jgi:hypothetical protein
MSHDLHSTDDFYNDAVMFRDLSRTLRDFIGTMPCSCIQTPQYKAYLDGLAEMRNTLTQSDFLAWIIFHDFDGETVAHECERCSVLMKYDDAVGEEVVDMETSIRLERQQREWDN